MKKQENKSKKKKKKLLKMPTLQRWAERISHKLEKNTVSHSNKGSKSLVIKRSDGIKAGKCVDC